MFLLWPLRYSFVRPETGGVFGWLFAVLLGFDKPFNQAPSLHIVLLVVLWVRYAQHLCGVWRWLLHAWFALIGVSVLTTYQHHFLDIPTGLAVGWLCVWMWPERIAAPFARARFARDLRRWRLAVMYLAGALVSAALALWSGGAGLWLLWIALALLLVALNYALLGPGGFQKRSDGRLSLAARWLYAPYLMAAWCNSRLWTRRAPSPRAVCDGVWLGRIPLPGQRDERAAVVDVSAELVVRRAGAGPCGADARSGRTVASATTRGGAGDRAGACARPGAGVLRIGLFAQCCQHGHLAGAQRPRPGRGCGHRTATRRAAVDRAWARASRGDRGGMRRS